MSGGSLSDRLTRLRAMKAARESTRESYAPGSVEARPAADRSAHSDNAVRPVSAEDGRPFEILLEHSGWERLGTWTWKKSTVLDTDVHPRLRLCLLRGEEIGCDRLVFFDTETTGLSGGAGNHVFLFGAGTVLGDGSGKFRIDQYFLSDFPGEPEFLSSFAHVFDGEPVLVSYNGKSFDCNILSTRFLMNGMRLVFSRHIDLLYPSRMLWKSLLPSCSLSSVERSVLSIDRIDDVPGSAVPDIFFGFLKDGDPGMLLRVFEHNLADISSLLKLLLHLENLFENPSPGSFADLHRLARFLLARNEAAGVRLLEACREEGDAFAGNLLGTHFRRLGNYAEAERVWKVAFLTRGSVFAGIELAKLYEHRLKDPAAALAVTEAVIVRPRPFRVSAEDDLTRRRNRLLRKLGVHP